MIVQAPIFNNFFLIRLRVRDLQAVGLGLGLLRSLVSHVLVLLTDGVHVDGSGSLSDLCEGAAGLGGGSAGHAAGWRATTRGTVGVRVELGLVRSPASGGRARGCDRGRGPDATGRLGVET